MTPPKPEPVKLRVRLDQIELLMLRDGIKSNAELNRRMNCDLTDTTVWKIRRRTEPYPLNVKFIAGLMNAFPDVPLEQLFTIVTDEDAQAVA